MCVARCCVFWWRIFRFEASDVWGTCFGLASGCFAPVTQLVANTEAGEGQEKQLWGGAGARLGFSGDLCVGLL